MTISELINKLQELQKEYPNLYLSSKNHLIEKPYRRKDKYFITISEDLSSEIRRDLLEYRSSYK
jgi:predicted MPP superfamily phosphohydrolase